MKGISIKSGFNLVEVALALLVVSIGMLGLIALMPIGLTASRDAASDTELSMLAVSIDSALRGYAITNGAGQMSSFSYDWNGAGLTPGNRVSILKNDGYSVLCGAHLRLLNDGQYTKAILSLYPYNRTSRPLKFTTMYQVQ